MMSRRAALARTFALASVSALAGCQVPGTGDPPQLYTLTPKSTFAADLPTVEWQLIVETPVAAAGLSTSRIALQRSPLQLDYYARANWTDSAPLMVQTLLIESFENSKRIVAVSRESTNLRADYVLKTDLREFQAEYDGGGPPLVRIRLTGKLVRLPERAIIASRSSELSLRAASSDMQSIVGAFDEALGKVLREQVEWTLRAPATTRRHQSVSG
ncbi:MAG TPA: ABC-type transport auxiliary lipoprotein family protein [Alphaproteobacteria bacterium]|nr:ABC-type transport auxiliary lipoprotein family protein [Alphaproteobacteria bacterium]